MKLSCNVIEDLLPLYHDDICSADSKALVDEHLRDCEHCKSALSAMDGEIDLGTMDYDGQKALEGIQNTWKKSKRKALIKGIAIALAVIVLGFSAAGLLWYRTCAVFYLELAETMMEQYPQVSPEYPHEYNAPTTPGQTEEEPPLWFFPKEYFVGTSQYEYWLRLPGFLDFTGGVLSVTPTDDLGKEDIPYISLGIQFVKGQAEYIIDVIDETNDVFTVFLVDGAPKLLYTERYPSEESISQDQEILEMYYEDIQSLVNAAKDMWGLE